MDRLCSVAIFARPSEGSPDRKEGEGGQAVVATTV